MSRPSKHFLLSGFTMVEILIVVSIIAIMAGILFMGNINSSYRKARDSKRKQDLNKLARTLEDYYNDNQRYPPENNPPDGTIADAVWGSPFGNYLPQLPKDPLSPAKYFDYYYQAGSGGKFYVLYAKLENTSDSDITRLGCQNGCGPMDDTGYRAFNYFVSSGDVLMADGIPNGQDPGALHGAPTATPIIPTAGGPTPTPQCPPDLPHDLCCGNNQCCRSSVGEYCGPQQCPGDNNKCIFVSQQWRYLCNFDRVQCP